MSQPGTDALPRPPGEPPQARRPTVVRLITRMNIGGPARQAILLTKGLAPEFCTVLAAGRPAEAEGELTDPEVPVERVPLVRPVSPATDLRCLYAISRLLRTRRPALVHTHMAKAGTIGRLSALTAFARDVRPRMVHTFHGHVLQGYFAGAQQRAFIELERQLARLTDVLIAVSPEVRDELLDLGIGTPSKYTVVPLGLDLDACLAVGSPGGPVGRLRETLMLGDDVPLAGIVGRLVPIKDHATLFEAVAKVPGLHLAVLGDGELRGSLEAMTGELGIGDRVHFMGWWLDIATALADLDFVVLSSRNEGTPVALIEALASGTPVVSTEAGGVRHVVQDEETGWLCRPGDPVALAALLKRALTNRGAALGLAEEGRRRVAARFSGARMIADHVALYQELLGN